MAKKGLFMAKSKIRIIFTPNPDDKEINKIAENLSVDLSKIDDVAKKREILLSLTNTFTENLNKIYKLSINSAKYPGSDIWRFFKNDVSDYCISQDPNYRNILFIFSDGYIYHEDDQKKEGNRTSYINPNSINIFRNKSDWKNIFDENGYGLIKTREDLANLEIVVMEISALSGYSCDEDIIKYYLAKWFNEMNVNYYELYCTDLPALSKSRIDNFLKKKRNINSNVAIKLSGKNYRLREIQNNEVVKGLKGKYFYVNIFQADYHKLLEFPAGKYFLDNFNLYGDAFSEFSNEVLKALSLNKDLHYEVFIKGSADHAGNKTFSASLNPDYYYKTVCYYEKFNDKNSLFIPNTKCDTIKQPITNKDLPNLRANFLKEKYETIMTIYKSPIILDGNVELDISSKKRNVALILYFSEISNSK